MATYTLGKPAREALFTVVGREEKYGAKLCIDTLILRLGDTLAGGLFHLLDGRLRLGEPCQPPSKPRSTFRQSRNADSRTISNGFPACGLMLRGPCQQITPLGNSTRVCAWCVCMDVLGACMHA